MSWIVDNFEKFDKKISLIHREISGVMMKFIILKLKKITINLS